MFTVRDIFGLRKTEGVVGVEIEVEGMGLPKAVPGWKAHADGSLRGEALEYVTNGAVTLERLGRNLEALRKSMQENGTIVRDAHRGSVHVHVNVQEKNLVQIFTTLYLWLLVEPLWMRMCGNTRDGNLFCMTAGPSGDIPVYAKELLKRERKKAYYGWMQRGKYASLNTDCLAQFGSLEFRTFPSSCDPVKVRDWATWSAKLVERGTALDPDRMADEWNQLLANPRAYYGNIFGNSLNAVPDHTLHECAETGVENASDMLLVWAEHLATPVQPEKKQPMPEDPFAEYLLPDFDGEDEEDEDEDEDVDNDDEER